MIETKAQYERARKANAILYQGSAEKEILSRDLIETIEALREVARKAIAYEQTLAPFGSADEGFYHVGDEIALDNFQDAITALPDWIRT